MAKKKLEPYTLHATGRNAKAAQADYERQLAGLRQRVSELPDPVSTTFGIHVVVDNAVAKGELDFTGTDFSEAIKNADERYRGHRTIQSYQIEQLYMLPEVPSAKSPTAGEALNRTAQPYAAKTLAHLLK
ncbi:MAG: hypothetical protein ABIJ34_03300 [archaeon]